jgi:putative ABC transport system permease protein
MIVDLLHLSRSLRRSPASAAAAILTLSLTLGAGASIFAVVNAVLLTPLPFRDPGALVRVGEVPIAEATAASRRVTYATFEAWREQAGSLAVLEGIEGTNLTVTGLGAAERVSAIEVTPGFLTLLGVTPALGRAFEPDDVGRPIAILSHAFWRGKFAGDPGVVGRSIVLGGQSHTIVGVLPERLLEFDPSEVWRPLPLTPAQAARAGYRVGVVARLAPHVSRATLAAALDGVSRTSLPPARVVSIPLDTAVSGDATRTLGLLAAAAALAILIAFTNLAGLLIVRSIDRRRELAIRSALGARRSEIARQLLLEAQALVVIGAVGGVLLAMWMTPVVGHLALEQFGGLRHRDIAVSWQVIAVVATAASGCAWLCALVPALTAARRSVLDVLRRGATLPPRELLFRRLLVTAEVALAFVLLACVTILGGGLLRLLKADPGFDARGVLALKVSVPAATYNPERVTAFYSALQSTLEGRLGSRSVAIVNELPLGGTAGLSLIGVRPGDVGREAVVREAGPAYFDVMRIPIVAGRSFEPRDNASAPQRVVISELLAARLAFEQPLGLPAVASAMVGRHIWLAAGTRMAEIIGVVGDVKSSRLDDAFLPSAYLSPSQAPSRSCVVVVRSARPDADVIASVREEVGRLDGDLPVYGVKSMEDVVASSPGMSTRRVLTATFMGFALLALVLGAIGLFGVVAHDVATRRTELALRMALGADPMRILSATLGQGAVLVGSGLAAGGLLSIWAAHALSGIGFATDGLDVLSVSLPAALLIIAGAAAVLPAARRAAHTDPLIALRSE